jgi:hypothetical protein
MVVPTFSQTSNQSTCNLTITQSPTVRGIRLGMSAEEVFALFPGSAERMDYKNAMLSAQVPPNYGVARLYFQPAAYPSPAKDRFSGIDSISITLFDGRATEITVTYTGYPKGPSWLNVDDFITKLSDAFALPGAKDWLQSGGDQSSKTLKCSGFEIRASDLRNGSMSLSNNSYTETVRQRAVADEERKRREFKP